MVNRVGEFERVSFVHFFEFISQATYHDIKDKLTIEELWNEISLPRRSTSGSSGYDFIAPFSFSLDAGKTIQIPTGVRTW